MNKMIRNGEIPTAKRRRFGMIIVLGSLTALAPLSMDMYLPSLPAIAHELQASTSMTQLSLMFCLLGLALGQLLAGLLSDARGRRSPLMIGITIYIAASFLCGVTSSIYVLIGLRLVQGLAGSAGIVIARAIVRDHYSGSEMTKFFALLMLVNGAAPILAPVIGGQLLRFTSWHGVFVVLGVIGVFLLLGAMIGLAESLPKERRQKGGVKKTLASMRTLLSDRLFMGYSFSQGLVFAAMFAYISGSPFVLQELYGMSPQAFSVVFGANAIGIILAGQISAKLCFHIGEKKVLIIGLGLSSFGSLVLLTMIQSGAGLVGILPSLFIVVASVGLVGPPSTSLALQEHGHQAGSASALMGMLQMGLGALVIPLVGIGDSHSATPMGLGIAFCGVSAFLCYVFLVRGYKRIPSED